MQEGKRTEEWGSHYNQLERVTHNRIYLLHTRAQKNIDGLDPAQAEWL